jgi:hypothetical protein
MLEREKGSITAMVVNPAADNIDLVYLGFAYNTGRLSKGAGSL